jgi:hypothetical protein
MKSEGLYTVVLDYAGGTYIAQVQAACRAQRYPNGCRKSNMENWRHGESVGRNLLKSREVKRSSIDGCRNVWCVSVR